MRITVCQRNKMQLLLSFTFLLVDSELQGSTALLLRNLEVGKPAVSIHDSEVLAGPDQRKVLKEGSIVACSRVEDDKVWISSPLVGWIKKTDLATPEDAEQFWKQQVEERPSDPLAHRILSEIQLRSGDVDFANETITRARELAPDDPYVEVLSLMAITLAEGVPATKAKLESICQKRLFTEPSAKLVLECLEGFDEHGISEKILDSLQLDPQTSDPALVLFAAKRAIRENDLSQALDTLNKAILRDSWNANAFERRAIVHGESGRYLDAIGDCERARELLPNNHVVLRHLGSYYGLAGNEKKETAFLRQSLELAPNDSETCYVLGSELIKDLLRRNQAITAESASECLALLEKACELTDYRNGEYLRQLCIAYATARQPEKAHRIVNQGLMKCGDDEESRKFLEETHSMIDEVTTVRRH